MSRRSGCCSNPATASVLALAHGGPPNYAFAMPVLSGRWDGSERRSGQVLARFLVDAPERVQVTTGFRTMKWREAAVKLKRFEADEKARKVAELEHMIREFKGMARCLDRQVKAEEDRTEAKDHTHFAYSTFATSASQRRDNLRASVAGLMAELKVAQHERDKALEQMARTDTPATRIVAVGSLTSVE